MVQPLKARLTTEKYELDGNRRFLSRNSTHASSFELVFMLKIHSYSTSPSARQCGSQIRERTPSPRGDETESETQHQGRLAPSKMPAVSSVRNTG